jgi:hypothetical protein
VGFFGSGGVSAVLSWFCVLVKSAFLFGLLEILVFGGVKISVMFGTIVSRRRRGQEGRGKHFRDWVVPYTVYV